ncbi:MAG: helicase-related protein [Candidatus Dojkabacteria bacterium]
MIDFSKITIDPDLPIAGYEEEIITKFEASSNMIIIGETGSGKTTQVPIMLLKSLQKYQDVPKGKIAVTEPRRLAATSVAEYVSSLVHDELGNTIGYKIRFSEAASDDSEVIFMTDGILLREAQLDPLLMQYSVIMVDEAHERNVNSDFVIGLLVDVQKRRRDKGLVPLKIIVTSATLEKEKFEDYFNEIEHEPLGIVEVPGRLYPITTIYQEKDVLDYEIEAADTVERIVNEKAQDKPGDILIFMPGKREIEKTREAIQTLPDFESLNLEIITVHANLPIEEQQEIFKESDKRKVVIATNIAETSLTVPGIVYVIDSGLIKQMEFNPNSGMNSLVTKHHSRKGLEQRKGRAGRVEPGMYYGLYTAQSFKERQEFQTPEILRTSLSQIVLVMKNIGIANVEHFRFIDQPDIRLLRNALLDLKRYGAIDHNERITRKGEIMANLPLEPKLSNLVIEADKHRCLESVCIICSFLELKPVQQYKTYDDFLQEEVAKYQQEREDAEVNIEYIDYQDLEELEDRARTMFTQYQSISRKFEYKGSDFLTYLNIWNRWQCNKDNPGWADKHYLSSETLEEAANILEELLEISAKSGFEPVDKKSKDLYKRIEKTIVKAFKYNMLVRQRNTLYRKINTRESDIRLHRSSVLLENKPEYAVAYEVIEISEIDALPKLSARTLHTIESHVVQHYFPKTFKKVRREHERSRNSRRKSAFKKSRHGNRRRRR